MISAAEQQVEGWPLPASLVERTESMRSRVAMFFSALTRVAVLTGIADNSSLGARSSRGGRAARSRRSLPSPAAARVSGGGPVTATPVDESKKRSPPVPALLLLILHARAVGKRRRTGLW